MLSLGQSVKLIEAAFAKGKALGLNPLCVAVLDAGGNLIALQRQDGASLLRPQIAVGKAQGALSLGIPSRKIAEMAIERPTFVSSLAALDNKGMIPAAGGVLVKGRDGVIIGAVGVTGDTSDNDEECAIAGIQSLELDQG